ncbi:hypothetical protein [Viridibacillus arvi]|uniref:hypothetical protein n=1 Tax=Viridibacillus arvi TaxID=263475 RepID=UPI0034CEA5A9
MKIYPTCSICKHFDSNKDFCSLRNEETFAMNHQKPDECTKNGIFIRDINVLLDSYHYYKETEEVPYDFVTDLSRLPVDRYGKPLFVNTKRGMERAVPAYEGIEMESDYLLGVNKAFTFQGQRELIYDLGVELAKKVVATKNIELVVLPGEENSKGDNYEIKRHMVYRNTYGETIQ